MLVISTTPEIARRPRSNLKTPLDQRTRTYLDDILNSYCSFCRTRSITFLNLNLNLDDDDVQASSRSSEYDYALFELMLSSVFVGQVIYTYIYTESTVDPAPHPRRVSSFPEKELEVYISFTFPGRQRGGIGGRESRYMREIQRSRQRGREG